MNNDVVNRQQTNKTKVNTMPETVEAKEPQKPKIEQPENPIIVEVGPRNGVSGKLKEQRRTRGQALGKTYFQPMFRNEAELLLFVGVDANLAKLIQDNLTNIPAASSSDIESGVASQARRLLERASADAYEQNLDPESGVFDEAGFKEDLLDFDAAAPTMSDLDDKIKDLNKAMAQGFRDEKPQEFIIDLARQAANLTKQYNRIKDKRAAKKLEAQSNGE